MNNFENKNIASKAGRKSKRGPAKGNKDLRQFIMKITVNNQHSVEQWFSKLGEEHPERALKIYIQLLDFVLPKLERTTTDEESYEDRVKREMQEIQEMFKSNP